MKIDHVGIAVSDMEAAVEFYTRSLGLRVTHREEVPAQKVSVVFLADADSDVAQIELLKPTSPDSPIAAFLEKRGPGQHHVAFLASDIRSEMKKLAAEGRPPMAEAPRPGARGHEVCFIHPKHAGGVLVELVAHGGVHGKAS